MSQLPKSRLSLNRYYVVENIPTAKSTWQTDYNRKEGSSSRRRNDALFSETRIFPAYPGNDSRGSGDENAENLESLIKVSVVIGTAFNLT